MKTYVFLMNDGSWYASSGDSQTSAFHNLCEKEGWNPTAASSNVLAAFKNSVESSLYHPEFDE